MTPKTIIISAFFLIIATVGFTKAMTPPPVILTPEQSQIIQLTNEIKNNSAIYDQAQGKITEAQKVLDLNVPIRDQAEADNVPKRKAIDDLTRAPRGTANSGNGGAESGTSGKTVPSL